MNDCNDTTLLALIRSHLKPILMNERAEESVSRAIQKQIAFLDWKPPPNSKFFEFKEKLDKVVEHFADDGLTHDAYIRAAVQQPPLFTMKPETIICNIDGAVRHFADNGLTRIQYLKSAMRAPSLFYKPPATVAGNIDGVVQHFAEDGLARTHYLRAALKQPSLFTMKPATVAGNIDGVVQHFAEDGLARTHYLRTALKQPTLFMMKPATVAGNIDGVVQHFAEDGLARTHYLRAALKQPSLFTMKPATVAGNIDGVVQHFAEDGLARTHYLRAALKQPTLFMMKPATVIRHIEMLNSFVNSGLDKQATATGHLSTSTLLPLLLSDPRLLCLSEENIVLRTMNQHINNLTPSLNLMRPPRKQIESALMKSLGHTDPLLPIPKNNFQAGDTSSYARNLLLRALVHAGVVQGRLR